MSVLSWNTPVTISGFTASDPRVVVDSNGNSTAVWIEQSVYNIGTSSQSGTTITGTGTTFTVSMVGGTIVYANGITANITAFSSTTSLTTAESLTISGQAYTIYYNGVINTAYLPNGGSWSSATQLSTTGNNSVTPKMIIDPNNIISVVWTENTVINYVSHNGFWSSVTALSTGSGASNPTLNFNIAGDVAVAWIKSAKTEVIVKPISTGIWSSITTFTTTNSDNPSIGVGGTTVTVVWHAIPGTDDQIMASIATTIGGTFSTPVNVIAVGGLGNNNYPKVVVDNYGNSFVAWFRSDFGGSMGTDYINVQVQASALVANTSSWSLPFTISSTNNTGGMGNPSNYVLKILLDSSGNASAIWTSSYYSNLINVESIVRQLAGNLSSIYNLASSNLTAYDFSVSINTLSNLLVLYMYHDGTNSIIQATETDIGGNPVNFYTSPTTISTANTNNSQPRGCTSITGNTINATAVWKSYDSINNTTIIQAATGSKTLLGAPSSLTVNQTANNFGVFTEFDNNLSWTDTTDPNAIGYNIYRNGIAISQASVGFPQFVDNNRTQSGTGVTVNYSVAAFDSNYQQSHRISVNLS